MGSTVIFCPDVCASEASPPEGGRLEVPSLAPKPGLMGESKMWGPEVGGSEGISAGMCASEAAVSDGRGNAMKGAVLPLAGESPVAAGGVTLVLILGE